MVSAEYRYIFLIFKLQNSFLLKQGFCMTEKGVCAAKIRDKGASDFDK